MLGTENQSSMSAVQTVGSSPWELLPTCDEKNIYLAHFGSQENLWSGRVRLMVITVAVEQ